MCVSVCETPELPDQMHSSSQSLAAAAATASAAAAAAAVIVHLQVTVHFVTNKKWEGLFCKWEGLCCIHPPEISVSSADVG